MCCLEHVTWPWPMGAHRKSKSLSANVRLGIWRPWELLSNSITGRNFGPPKAVSAATLWSGKSVALLMMGLMMMNSGISGEMAAVGDAVQDVQLLTDVSVEGVPIHGGAEASRLVHSAVDVGLGGALLRVLESMSD